MSIAEFLHKSVPFLGGITEDQAAYLAQKADTLKFKKGQTVIFRGTSVEGVHVIAKGKVTVHLKPEKSKDLVQIAELGPGEVFGETSIIEFKMAGATIKCAEDDTTIYVIHQKMFLKLLEADEDFKSRTLNLIEQRQAARHGGKKRDDAVPRDDEAAKALEQKPAGEAGGSGAASPESA